MNASGQTQRHPVNAVLPIDSEGWSVDEVAMLRFLAMCVPSLDPDSYENVLEACRFLSMARPCLSEGSTLKCLKELFGDDYELAERGALR